MNEKAILFESFNGDDFTGNPFYLLLEACSNERYSGYTKYVAVKKSDLENDKKVETLLRNYDLLDQVVLVRRNSREYCKLLASAKYLVNNVTFPTFFIKREGQVYLNTWHGTPLKGLGRNIKDNPNTIGNVQRNFLMSDYLLYPNKYSFEHIRHDYMLDQFYTGQYVLSGYPCNSAFFDQSRVDSIKEQLEISDKKVVVYMPTWRGKEKGKKVDKHIFYILHLLYEMESKLDDDVVVFVKLHHLAMSSIELDEFEKIKAFPTEFETYDFLNVADCLITDYSSVMFDYLNTDKKVFLYTYDKEEYMAGRSIYTDIDTLPFQAFDTPKPLCEALNAQLGSVSYGTYRDMFCHYDSAYAAKDLLALLIFGEVSERMELIDGKKFRNNKPNVLIFAGELAKNGLTTALKGLINYVDTSKMNYVLTFYTKKTNRNKQVINEFRDEISYIPIQGAKNLTFIGAVCQLLYFKMNIDTAFVNRQIEKNAAREVERSYPTIHFDYAIHYTGYERHIIHIINALDAKKAIYTHNDLLKERKTRNNIHVPSLKKAYRQYDRIVIIRESMREEIKKNIPGVDDTKIVVAHNLNNLELIKRRAKKKVTFDDDTYCNIELDELNSVLQNKNVLKFIDIARFSPEKGLDQLIFAFNRFRKENPDAYLIIVGGHGKDFDAICALAESEETKNVIIIRSISNPYPILAKCDCFVLSSHYEGLPMTIMEALILDKKVISTNIPGPSEFLSQGYGYLVEDSVDGILKGMQEFEKTGLKTLTKFDAQAFNKNALAEFEAIFN
ncbi:MAG TPA: CDP-glycerol glycerophosphotransferase family protein [Candidatus Scubalenecus merdavium]|uniref:CDP-glycerol glycerophosphotransferase family protein n=1 Tax=Candidatus Scybalenecus merdavium TaxID=2840939 RepID=A0A9D1MV78_9FIRM|nr:CDP-glycerol glycerophosphotransferase family protein [Candidatus Scubalenecus merdavium]